MLTTKDMPLVSKDDNTYSGVIPFTQSPLFNGNSDKRQVVYAIFDESKNDMYPCHCFFEDECIEGFAMYRKMPSAKLWVSYLHVNDTCPKKVWDNNEDYMDEHHGNVLGWYEKYNAWCL